MQNRIRVASVIVGSLAASLGIVSAASASADRANLGCVTRGEFSSIEVGATRPQVEAAWGMRGLSVWDRDNSDPGHDTYLYRRCGKRPDDRANIVRVTYSRHSRVWTEAWLRAHGVTVEAVTPAIN